MNDSINLFVESFQQFLNQVATFLPRLLGAIIIFILGWLVARLLKTIFVKLLKVSKLSVLTEKSGIDKFFKEGGLKINTISILGTLFYWGIMLIVIITTLNSLNLTIASTIFPQFMLFIPNIIVSIIILIVGIYLARIVSQIVKVSLKNMHEKKANSLTKLTYTSIIILTVFITLGQLNIASSIITSAFQIIFGSICLALALAFGLGGKDKAAEIIKDIFKKK